MKPEKKKKYADLKVTKRKRLMNTVYLVSVLLIFELIGVMFLVFPRETVSEKEQRELAKFPELTSESYLSGEFTEGLSKWFSDTVPFRDNLMEMSASLQELCGFRQNDIKIHGMGEVIKPQEKPTATTKPDSPEKPSDDTSKPILDITDPDASQTTTPHTNSQIDPVESDEPIDPNDAVTIMNNGIAVVGSGSETRALMLYGGNYNVGESYAKVINKYDELLPDNVRVYSMIIPTSAEFYSPPEVKPYTASQLDNINWVIENLSDSVYAVDVYTTLSQHLDENIYTRTDHHWGSLGAYYAAQTFAEAAGVPFMDISEYTQKVIHNYVGTMYTYSDYDPNIKNNPEEFYYYVPNGVDYTTTYTDYILDEDGRISGAKKPYQGNFFMKYPDGSSMAYCTFMGGDSKITKVETDTDNGRRLAIFKDSYGNALPAFLFGSFEEIHVIDMRYFTENSVQYLTENGITDVLFANNAFHAATASTVKYYDRFLTQNPQTAVTTPPSTTAKPETTVPEESEPEEITPPATESPAESVATEAPAETAPPETIPQTTAAYEELVIPTESDVPEETTVPEETEVISESEAPAESQVPEETEATTEDNEAPIESGVPVEDTPEEITE